MSTTGASVARDPEFTLTAPRGTYTVSKSATFGQKITKGATLGTFTFSNDGIHRVITSGGTTVADFTTMTTADMTITGSARAGRVLNGGTLRITNNTTAAYCDFSPSNITWPSSGTQCTCGTSGSWTGTCSDGKTGTVDITGCGTGKLTIDGSSADVTFDHCSLI
jgi:hypothetical protein